MHRRSNHGTWVPLCPPRERGIHITGALIVCHTGVINFHPGSRWDAVTRDILAGSLWFNSCSNALAMARAPFSLVVAILTALRGVRNQIQKLIPDLSVSSMSWCLLFPLLESTVGLLVFYFSTAVCKGPVTQSLRPSRDLSATDFLLHV